ncbi:MAG: hypothetical protein AAGK05_14670 [Pseudomonadota bacterium]
MEDPTKIPTADIKITYEEKDGTEKEIEDDGDKDKLRPDDKDPLEVVAKKVVIRIKLSKTDVEYEKYVLTVKDNVKESRTVIKAKSETVDTRTNIDVSLSSLKKSISKTILYTVDIYQ